VKWASVLGASIAIGALLVMTTLTANGAIRNPLRPSLAANADPTSCTVGVGPLGPGYDPVTHDIYVLNSGSDNISVLNGACKVIGTVNLPSGAVPQQATFDPRYNYMEVTDSAQNQVYQISGTTIVNTIRGFHSPIGIAYDPACYVAIGILGCTVVANGAGTTVETLSGVSFPVGAEPEGLAYDSFWDTVVVANSASDNVTVLNAETLASVANVGVGTEPYGVAFDPADSEDYVTNFGSNNVTVLGGSAGPGGIDGWITGFDEPTGVAWDQSNLHIYVSNLGLGKVFELSGLSIVKKESTAIGSEAYGLAYDEATDKMFVASSNTNVVYIIS